MDVKGIKASCTTTTGKSVTVDAKVHRVCTSTAFGACVSGYAVVDGLWIKIDNVNYPTNYATQLYIANSSGSMNFFLRLPAQVNGCSWVKIPNSQISSISTYTLSQDINYIKDVDTIDDLKNRINERLFCGGSDQVSITKYYENSTFYSVKSSDMPDVSGRAAV